MKNIDLLVSAKWIAPIEPENIVLENHAIAVDHGKIIDILPKQNCSNHYQAKHTEHFETHLLTPGFINAHTHSAMSLMRGIADDLPLMEWLNDHIWPVEAKWANEEFIHDGSLLAIAEMIRSGTTCFNDMYFFPEITAHVASTHGFRANLGMIFIDFPSNYATTADEYFDKGLALHNQYQHESLISLAFSPHAPYTVSNQPLERIRTLADQLNVPIHMHINETNDEIQHSLDNYDIRPIERLKNLGLLTSSLLAVHMTHTSEQEIMWCAENGVNIIHCPESNLKLASGFCQVDQMLKQNINICLGTDGAASNNDLDMISEMRMAALLGKNVANDASAASAETVLKMATINAAKALNLDHIIGSLIPEKAADFIAINMNCIETQPLYHPISQLVYSTGRHQVTDVWIAGKHLLKNRKLTTMDEQKIIQIATKWRDRLG